MIYSRREFVMVIIIIAVLIGGLTFLIVQPMVGQWQQASAARRQLERDRAIAQRLIDTRAEWEGKLGGLRSSLPLYRKDEAVGADLLRQVRRLADENGVVTTRITPEEEKNIGDLYEQAIECTWEAELEPLVKFMFAVQIAGATLDIRQMTVTPSQETRLKGNMKIFFAYKRGEPVADEPVPAVEAPVAEAPAAEGGVELPVLEPVPVEGAP